MYLITLQNLYSTEQNALTVWSLAECNMLCWTNVRIDFSKHSWVLSRLLVYSSMNQNKQMTKSFIKKSYMYVFCFWNVQTSPNNFLVLKNFYVLFLVILEVFVPICPKNIPNKFYQQQDWLLCFNIKVQINDYPVNQSTDNRKKKNNKIRKNIKLPVAPTMCNNNNNNNQCSQWKNKNPASMPCPLL
jgi:hypothetical protein